MGWVARTGKVTQVTTIVRTGLSRDVIARAALELTDEVGLAGLSMRKLGAALGVEAMSLYHYVTNKDDLLDAILDVLYGEIALPWDLAHDDWETGTRLGLRAFRQVLLDHPAALELFASRPAKTTSALNVLLWAHGRIHAVGVAQPQACHAVHFAVSFVMGHAASEVGVLALLRDGKGPDPYSFEDPAARDFLLGTRDLSADDMFEAGLDLVVAGLRAAYQLP